MIRSQVMFPHRAISFKVKSNISLDKNQFLLVFCETFQLFLNGVVFPFKIFSNLKHALLNCNGWVAWGTTVTVLLVLVTLALWVRNRLDKNLSEKKVKERDDKLAEKDGGKSVSD